MKGSRLKDVLDDKPFNKAFWDIMFGKLKKLATRIEMFKGPEMSIDDTEYRWVGDRIEYYEGDERLLSKEAKEALFKGTEYEELIPELDNLVFTVNKIGIAAEQMGNPSGTARVLNTIGLFGNSH